MEPGCSVFLQEEEDNKENVLFSDKRTVEQTNITELTNIFKNTNKQTSNETEPLDDNIGIVEMGGSFYCSGCDFVDTRYAAENHLRTAHSEGKGEKAGLPEKQLLRSAQHARKEREGLLKCQLCKEDYPEVPIITIKKLSLFKSSTLNPGSVWLHGAHGKEPQNGGKQPSSGNQSLFLCPG